MQGPAPQADCKTASDDRSTNAMDRHVKARPVRSHAARPSGVWGLALPFDMTFKPWFVDKAFQRWCVRSQHHRCLAGTSGGCVVLYVQQSSTWAGLPSRGTEFILRILLVGVTADATTLSSPASHHLQCG